MKNYDYDTLFEILKKHLHYVPSSAMKAVIVGTIYSNPKLLEDIKKWVLKNV